jgi:hypothetical protein
MACGPVKSDSLSRPPLRVGILVDSFSQPAWVARAVESIVTSPHAELALVVRRVAPVSTATQRQGGIARLRRVWKNRHLLLWVLYARADKRRLSPLAHDPFEPVDIEPLLAGFPVIEVAPRQTRFSDYFSDVDADAIDAHGLDVAVRFGFRILRGRALQIARHGVWSWHHGDNSVNRGGPPGFWEVIEGAPATGSILQILTEEVDDGRVLYRSWTRTHPHSMWQNRHAYYWKSAAFLGRALERLHEQGEPMLDEAPWRPYSNHFYRTPTNAAMVRGLTRVVARYARARLQGFVRAEQWFLAYRIHPQEAPPDVPDPAPFRFRELLPPKDRFWADPFPVRRDGRYWIFFEEKVSSKPGWIAVVEIGPDGMIGQPKRALERPYHLSYPFVFEWQGQTYMIPETEQNRTVELYRAEKFPTGWTLERVLLSDLRAVDATLAEIDGRWWMFVNVAESEETSLADELHLYHADSPLGPWKRHTQNPVKSDVRSARPAGRPFHHAGAWYRPSQDSSERYGAAVVVNRMTRLDTTRYAEEEVGRLLPRWRSNLVATHTLNAASGLTVVDAKRLYWRIPGRIARLLGQE